jgi:hypothetical protein
MSSQDKIDRDGIRDDHVPHDPADSYRKIYADGRRQLLTFQTPVMLHANNQHERLYVAALDGTGNDVFHNPEHATNVGLIYKQLANEANPKVATGYVAGPGTQTNVISRTLDGATGNTSDARAEQMYKKFIDQAWQWRQQDPDAQIRLAGVGFSRGADEVALLARLVEERGIQDPAGARYTYDSRHQISHVEYANPPLVPPHQVAQAVVLFDPVGTGHEMHEDRRLPPSVISGIQLTALDEHRSLFKSDRIIDPGITPDGRFAGVYVPGAHSDVGGGYHRNGLSARAGNLAIDYLNGLSDRPYLAKQVEPDDPRLNVIHHSEDGNLLFRLAPKIDRTAPGGYNELEVSRRDIGHVSDPYNAESRYQSFNQQFERQNLPDGSLPAVTRQPEDAPKSELDQWIDRMYQASQNPDSSVWNSAQHRAAQDYLSSPGGQQFQQQASDLNKTWDMQQLAVQHAPQRDLAAQQAMQQQTQQTQQTSQGFGR